MEKIMDHYIVTWGNKTYKVTEEQCEKFADAYAEGKIKLLPLPSGALVAASDIRYIGKQKDAPAVVDKSYAPPEPPQQEIGYLPVAELFLNGKVTGVFDESKKIKMMAKKIWYEHTKRTPMLNKIHKLNYGEFTAKEQRIINTPLDQLMEEFEKSLAC